MIVCKECGNHNEDGAEFCGSCGSFLEFTGERIEEPETAVPPPQTAPEPAPAPEQGPAKPKTPKRGARRKPDEAPVDRPAAAAPVSPDAPTTQMPAAAHGAPAESDAPAAQQPQAVKPTAERVRPAPKTNLGPSRAPINPGDLICGQCGEGNDPARRFCRRCGASLVAAQVAKPLPWWKRIFQRKPKAASAAGERPGRAGAAPKSGSKVREVRSGMSSTLVKIGFVLAILAIVGVAVIPDLRDRALCLVRPELLQVFPTKASGTSIGGHPPSDAIDKNTATYWAEGGDGAGKGEVLTLAFERPVDIAQVGFTLGAQSKEGKKDFLSQPRPSSVRLVYINPKGKPVGSDNITDLEDKTDFQEREVEAENVKTVRMTIRDVRQAQEGGGTAAAIAELEFWQNEC